MRRALFLACVLVLGCEDELVTLPAPEVKVLTPSDAGVDEFGLVAVVVPHESIDVGANIGGQVASVRVRIGDEVKKGQPLAAMDDRPLYEELAVARAERRTAQATLAEFEVEARAAEEALRIEKKSVDLNVGAKRKQIEAEFALERAVAQRDQARARVSEQSARIKSLRRQITSAVVRAPFDGTVAKRYLDPGVFIQIGAPVVRLIGSGSLRIRFAVKNEDASAVKVGDKFTFVSEQPRLEVPVTVTQVAPEIDPVTQLLVVEADPELDAESAKIVQAGVTGRVRRR